MRIILSATLFIFTFLNVAYANEVNLFTSRHYDSDVKLYQKFTAKTGIKVNVVSGKAKALEKRLLSEGKSSKADVYITVDAGALGSAKAKGIFQRINSKTLNSHFHNVEVIGVIPRLTKKEIKKVYNNASDLYDYLPDLN